MRYQIRQATTEQIRPTFDLALRVFMKYEAPYYKPEAVDNFKADITENKEYFDRCASGKNLLYIAVDGDRIIGVIGQRGEGHIGIVFVDGAYHRQGIATALMKKVICEMKLQGSGKITLNSSPYGLPFYKNFGFIEAGPEQTLNGFVFTPMEYRINVL